MSAGRKVTIRVDLVEGDPLRNEFLYLKKRKGLKNNSEVIRQLITEEYARLRNPFFQKG